jgi:UDP-glucuronate 4-epimerase
LVYASSSSIYGGNKNLPYSEGQATDSPLSFYAATKKANELMAHSYSHLYKIPMTGLRFFTVYGPWGRPDMAYYQFTKSIIEGEPIKIFNNGNMLRDFTYIDDVVNGIYLSLLNPPEITTSNLPPFKIFNLGNENPINLVDFIRCIEDALGMKARKIFMEMQEGDMHQTFADMNNFKKWVKFSPKIDVQTGISKFVEWYKKRYCIL